MRSRHLLALVLLGACGGDDAPPPPPAKPAAAAPGGANAQKDDKNKLQPRMHAEERVVCSAPEKPTGPVCKPGEATCEAGLYCLQQLDASFHCEPCPERDSIRHEFKDRDFVGDGTAEHARDPFQSFVIQTDVGHKPSESVEIGPCTRSEQFVAQNYSYQELKLVGIVTQGAQRKVLMMAGNKGQIIKRGDCVGKEKAFVKDIGTGYVTFLINPEQPDNQPKRPSEEHSIQLYPNGPEVMIEQLAPIAPPSTGTGPTVAPPAGTPTVPPPAGMPTVAPPPVAPPKK